MKDLKHAQEEPVIRFHLARQLHELGIRDVHLTRPFPYVSRYYEPKTKTIRRYGFRGANWKNLYYAPTINEALKFFENNYFLRVNVFNNRGYTTEYYYEIYYKNHNTPILFKRDYTYESVEIAREEAVNALLNILQGNHIFKLPN